MVEIALKAKVGAPPELACLLEEIGRESHRMNARREIVEGPELDHFMVCMF